MRKFLTSLPAIACVLLLAGCGGNSVDIGSLVPSLDIGSLMPSFLGGDDPPAEEIQPASTIAEGGPAPVFAPLPEGTVVLPEAGAGQVIQALAAAPGLQNMVRGPGNPAAGQGLQLRISALVRSGLRGTATHTALMTGAPGQVDIAYLAPALLLDTRIAWRPSGFARRAWNDAVPRPVTFAQLDAEILAQTAPLLFTGLQRGWRIQTVALADIGKGGTLIIDALPDRMAQPNPPVAAARFWFDAGTGMPHQGWYRLATGGEATLRFSLGIGPDGAGAITGFRGTVGGTSVIATITEVQAIPLTPSQPATPPITPSATSTPAAAAAERAIRG